MRSAFFYIAVMTLLLAGCTEEISHPITDEQVNVTLFPVPEEVAYGTRAVTADVDETATIKDLWVLVYNNDGDLKSAKYLESVTDNRISVVRPKAGSNEIYTVVLVANTEGKYFSEDKSGWTTSDYATLDDLKTKCGKTISSCNDLYEPLGDGKNYLMLNGFFTMDENYTGSEPVKLYRNVAKLTVTIDNTASSELTVNSIKIGNVPTELVYADKYASENGATYTYTAEFLDENLNISPNSGQTVFTYYLPRNCQGGLVNGAVPMNATYVQINGEEKYTFYLGKEKDTNFDVEPNHSYNLNLTVKGKEDITTDNANCYMLDATEYAGTGKIFEIPASQAIAGWNWVKKQITNNALVLTDAEKAEVVMPDKAIEDIKNGSWEIETRWLVNGKKTIIDNSKITGVKFTREDAVYPYIKLTFGSDITNGTNAVVSLKVDGKILWSWHLWFTDYKPDAYGASDEEMAGQVHTYNITSSKKRYMMDRNLGATITGVSGSIEPDSDGTFSDASGTNADKTKFYGFFYQYGKMTPLIHPEKHKLTDDISDISDDVNAPSDVNFLKSILYPCEFFKTGENKWLGTGSYIAIWSVEEKTKSPFDPCPKGWRIPVTTSNPWTKVTNASTDEGEEGYITYNASLKGLTYIVGNSGENNKAWYPLSCYRDISGDMYSSSTNYIDKMGKHWFAESSPISTYYFYFTNSTYPTFYKENSGTTYSAHACAVRCVRILQ